MNRTAKSKYLGNNLSMAEIMVMLDGNVLRISPDTPSA
jgi:transketolase N-terminal domain/subunit